MNEKESITVTPSRHRLRRLVATVAVFAAIVTGSVVAAAPATAATYGPQAGRPGVVAVGVSAAYQSSKRYTVYGHDNGAGVGLPNLNIYRSSGAAGGQVVAYRYFLRHWNGSSWAIVNYSQTHNVIIGANQSYVSVNPGYSLSAASAGNYYLELQVAWVSGSGASLGTSIMNLTQQRDYTCVLPVSGRPSGGCGWQNGYLMLW